MTILKIIFQIIEIFKIGDVNVTRVLRRGLSAIHITDNALNVGDELKCIIDWQRRFDHMQQHSGNIKND